MIKKYVFICCLLDDIMIGKVIVSLREFTVASEHEVDPRLECYGRNAARNGQAILCRTVGLRKVFFMPMPKELFCVFIYVTSHVEFNINFKIIFFLIFIFLNYTHRVPILL